MSNTSQKRAIAHYRSRLSQRGLARFEVLGLDSDRALIRTLAKRLAEAGSDAARIRAMVTQSMSGVSGKGGILAALHRSPLTGADLDLARAVDPGRPIEL